MRLSKEDMGEFLAGGIFPVDPAEVAGILDEEVVLRLEAVEIDGDVLPIESEGSPFFGSGDLIV